jgi:hypothetical protein
MAYRVDLTDRAARDLGRIYRNADAVAVLIDAVARRSVVRVDVSLPPDLLEAIDRVSGNLSRFLAEAAREKLRHA